MASSAEYDGYSDDYYTDEDYYDYMEQEYGSNGQDDSDSYDLPMTPRLEAYIRDLNARFGHTPKEEDESDKVSGNNTSTT